VAHAGFESRGWGGDVRVTSCCGVDDEGVEVVAGSRDQAGRFAAPQRPSGTSRLAGSSQ
jgi:hypothetical protein